MNPNFSLRIDDELLKKLRYIADYDDRSLNGEIQNILKQYIVKFEKEHGKIKLE